MIGDFLGVLFVGAPLVVASGAKVDTDQVGGNRGGSVVQCQWLKENVPMTNGVGVGMGRMGTYLVERGLMDNCLCLL